MPTTCGAGGCSGDWDRTARGNVSLLTGTILGSIREQGKLDAPLELAINSADSKARLEDIYLPYKPKRRTKGQIAREAGLEPLADRLLAGIEDPRQLAAGYVDPEKGIPDAEAALEGEIGKAH